MRDGGRERDEERVGRAGSGWGLDSGLAFTCCGSLIALLQALLADLEEARRLAGHRSMNNAEHSLFSDGLGCGFLLSGLDHHTPHIQRPKAPADVYVAQRWIRQQDVVLERMLAQLGARLAGECRARWGDSARRRASERGGNCFRATLLLSRLTRVLSHQGSFSGLHVM